MAVASILAQKGREVVTAPPDRSLQDVATILAERKIGAIVITDNSGRVLGMLSERDIVRAMAREGASALDDPVSRHMTERVVTTTEDATIPDTMERMTPAVSVIFPVIANERLVGIDLDRRHREMAARRDRKRAPGAQGIYRHRVIAFAQGQATGFRRRLTKGIRSCAACRPTLSAR